MSKNNKKGGILFLGAIFGFLFGIFFAPKKGIELRKDAKVKIKEVKENPKDAIKETYDEVKEKITSFVDDGDEDEDIKISEEDIVISKTFNSEGEVN